MATIPLSVGQRRLDTGNVVQYPEGSPVGRAMQGFGDELSAVAERYQQMKEQQEAFDAELARRRFNDQVAQAEDEAAAKAPADGSGLHDVMYGQVDPRTGRVVKTGLFDMLFDNALPNIPESQRANFARQKETMRAAGSLRMAQRQQAKRDEYELAEWAKVDNISTNAIAKSDPNDTATFEAIRQSGLDLIAKIGNPLARQTAEAAWRGKTAKALVQAMIAQDPKLAAEMLGAVPAGGGVRSDAVAGGSIASDRTTQKQPGNLSPDERAAQAFSGASAPSGAANTPLEAITYLKPADIAALKNEANTVAAARLIDGHARVRLAEQNAPSVIALTGKYPEGEEPAAQDFVSTYGAEDGTRHFDEFRATVDAANSFHNFYRASNREIHAELRDFEPGPKGTPEEHKRYEIRAGAAEMIMAARRADPVAYVTQLFPGEAPDWSKVSTPEDLQKAVNWALAAQQHVAFDSTLVVPQTFADKLGARYVDGNVPLQDRIIELSDYLKAVRDPEARFTFAGQIFRSALAHLTQNASNNPKSTPAELEAQGKALEADLIEMAGHPARVRFNASPWWQQAFVAANDDARFFANGATFDQADRFSAGMNSLFSDKSYSELLAAERAESEDAEDRAGYAAPAVKLLGAFVSGHGLQSAGLTATGKFAAEGLKGLPGFFARSATMAVDGAAFGGVDAALNGRDIVQEMGTGALFGFGGNALAEGLTAVGSRVVRKLTGRQADPETPAAEGGGNAGTKALEEGASAGKNLDQSVDLSEPGPELATGNPNTGATPSPTGRFYSVVFEMRLAPTSYPGVRRDLHYQEANEALLQAMEGDAAFAQAMQNHGINLRRTPRGLAPQDAPDGFSWHHADEPGVMQLVPRSQHDPGTIFQKVLHPNAKGGFSRWGK